MVTTVEAEVNAVTSAPHLRDTSSKHTHEIFEQACTVNYSRISPTPIPPTPTPNPPLGHTHNPSISLVNRRCPSTYTYTPAQTTSLVMNIPFTHQKTKKDTKQKTGQTKNQKQTKNSEAPNRNTKKTHRKRKRFYQLV
eukprot:m.155662 g.155662  ORF g.155662 m.155662 type:complete len:138 (+) comp30948_c0_seq1:1149-1562(+)